MSSTNPTPGQKPVSDMTPAEFESMKWNLIKQAARQRVTARDERDTAQALAEYQIKPK